MSRMTAIARFAAGLLSLQATTVLADQTVTFKVPVQLSNIYADVKSFSVGCTLRNKLNPLVNYAYGRTDTSVSKSYNATVSVPVVVPDSVAAQVDSWDCAIHLSTGGPGCAPAVDAPVNACKAKAGTQLVTKVGGKL